MYYIYFAYVVVLAAFMLTECHRKHQPGWWALMALFSPVTAPYFFYKLQKKCNITITIIFLISFSVVGGIEFFMYSNYMEKNKYSQFSPVTQKIIQLSEQLKLSTLKLDKGLIKLETLSTVESRINEIKKTIEFIHELREIIIENREDINSLVKYTSDHKNFFDEKDLYWVSNIQKFYTNRTVIQHYKSLDQYLNSFEGVLKYSYVNFYNITEYKTTEHLKNYDEYYIRYRRAVDSYNRFNVKRIEFQNLVLKQYPDIKTYLPGDRQTETLRLWE